MTPDPRDIQAIGLLDEPVRRTLYAWVVAAGRPVSRDEAAAGAGVSRALAAFHLDRLVAGGLLVPEYRRLTGRSGPGAGRPAKLYGRAEGEVAVSLPERRYDVAAGVLADAVERMAGDTPPQAVRDAARELGARVGEEARARTEGNAAPDGRREALVATLVQRGYEPFEDEHGDIRLRNCPFDALVDDHRDLVCGMNLALAEGIVEAMGDERLEPRLDPAPGTCCVAIGRSEAATRA